MKTIEIELTYAKSTPGTHVFQTSSPDASITSLYIKKDSPAFEGGRPPQAIRVTVAAVVTPAAS